MAIQIIEGTWEEIEARKSEFMGRQLKVIFESLDLSSSSATTAQSDFRPISSVYGKYAGILDSEDFIRNKHNEIELEDRSF